MVLHVTLAVCLPCPRQMVTLSLTVTLSETPLWWQT